MNYINYIKCTYIEYNERCIFKCIVAVCASNIVKLGLQSIIIYIMWIKQAIFWK